MDLEGYTSHDAVGLADLIRRGEVHPSELATRAIKAVNRTINGVIEAYDDAEDQPDASENEAFGGVPFLPKNIGATEQGRLTEMGSRLCEGVVAARDAGFTQRCRAAGLRFFGRTTTPEFGLHGTTETIACGTTANPWDPSRIAGGLGYPKISTELVVSRTMRDTALALDTLAGRQPGEPFDIPAPAVPWSHAITMAPRRLRVGVTTTTPDGASVHPEVAGNIEATAAVLEELGHEVVDTAPDFGCERLKGAFSALFAIMGTGAIGILADARSTRPLSSRSPCAGMSTHARSMPSPTSKHSPSATAPGYPRRYSTPPQPGRERGASVRTLPHSYLEHVRPTRNLRSDGTNNVRPAPGCAIRGPVRRRGHPAPGRYSTGAGHALERSPPPHTRCNFWSGMNAKDRVTQQRDRVSG